MDDGAICWRRLGIDGGSVQVTWWLRWPHSSRCESAEAQAAYSEPYQEVVVVLERNREGDCDLEDLRGTIVGRLSKGLEWKRFH